MWTFRPLAFQVGDYYECIRRSTLMGYNRADNKRAAQAGVCIPPAPQSSDCCQLRTCQWNIQYFLSDPSVDSHGFVRDVISTIVETKADVIVLNEFSVCNPDDDVTSYAKLLLKQHNYTVHCANCPYRTAIATKLPVIEEDTFALDHSRAAVALQVQIPSPMPEGKEQQNTRESIRIYATHLEDWDDDNGYCRKAEMETLLHNVATKDNNDRAAAAAAATMVIGDFNQQRQQDYTPHEWDLICANKLQRNSPVDDGVANALYQAGFSCIWDRNDAPINCNWPSTAANNKHPPPSTHWTGTIVDYTYYRGSNKLKIVPSGVYVSPCDLSDHRLIVCDWDLAVGKEQGEKRDS